MTSLNKACPIAPLGHAPPLDADGAWGAATVTAPGSMRGSMPSVVGGAKQGRRAGQIGADARVFAAFRRNWT